MNKPVWIAGLLLAVLAIQTARSEPKVPPGDAPVPAHQGLRRAVSREAQAQREPVPAPKPGRLSPEERSKLRQDVSDAGRRIYHPRPIPAHY